MPRPAGDPPLAPQNRPKSQVVRSQVVSWVLTLPQPFGSLTLCFLDSRRAFPRIRCLVLTKRSPRYFIGNTTVLLKSECHPNHLGNLIKLQLCAGQISRDADSQEGRQHSQARNLTAVLCLRFCVGSSLGPDAWPATGGLRRWRGGGGKR